MTLSRIGLVAPILAGLALVWAGPHGARAADQNPTAAAPIQTVPEDTSPGRSGSFEEPLGKKLDRTNGVIHPPKGIDPGLTVPPPQSGSTMPVIPPPGTQGGEPGPQSK